MMNFLKNLDDNFGNAARSIGSAVVDKVSQWKIPKSSYEVVELKENQMKGFIVQNNKPSQSFSVYSDNTKEPTFNIIYTEKRLSVFRSKILNESLEKAQHFKQQAALFAHIADKREAFDELINAVHNHPFWDSIHLASLCGLVTYLRILSKDPTFAALLNSPCHPEAKYPIHITAENGQLNALEFLISMGADLAKSDLNLNNAVHYAAANSSIILQELSKSKTFSRSCNLKNSSDFTPLFLAIRGRQSNSVAILLRSGAKTDILCQNNSALQEALALGLEPTAISTLTALIIGRPELITEQNENGNTALHTTTEKSILQILLKNCPSSTDFDIKNAKSQTPLNMAAIRDCIKCTATLLSFGAKIDTFDLNGDNVLHCAIRNGSLTVVKTLLCFGASVENLNKKAESPMQIAANLTQKSTRDAIQACLLLFSSDSRTKFEKPKFVLDDFLQTTYLGEKSRRKIELKSGKNAQKFVNLLSLDGGGIRGLILIQTLLHIESKLGQNLWSKFSWVAGTSTGAILSAALARGRSLNECQRLYFRFKDEVFKGRRPYNTEILETFLRDELGEEITMTHIEKPRLFVTAVCADRNPPQLVIHRNYSFPALLPFSEAEKHALGHTDQSWPLWKAVRCSSAAPTYFQSVDQKYVDGGLIANNPSLELLAEFQTHNAVQQYMGNNANCLEIGCFLSLGTGQIPSVSMDNIDIGLPLNIMNAFSLAKSAINLKNILIEQVYLRTEKSKDVEVLVDFLKHS